MASSIVTDALAADSRPSVIQEFVGHYFDAFQGDQSALIHAGLLSAGELEPQPNRAPGYTAFLPGGEPCPVGKKAWRTPGYRAIRQLDDGTIRLEITVSKELQAERRAAKRAQEYEAEQTRINEALASVGRHLQRKELQTSCGTRAEIWEGTKAQLQAAGLGVGMLFPGEPRAKREVACKCPMGFEFVIRQSSDKVEAAAGLFTAYSFYRSHETANERSQTRVAQRFASESQEQFRAAQTGTVNGFINMIFCALHSPALRAWRFDLPGDKDTTSKLAEAFQTIRDVLQQGEVVPNPKLQAHLQVAAARNNTALQTLLGSMQAQSSSSPGIDDA